MHAAIKESCGRKAQIFLFLVMSLTFTLPRNPALGHPTPEQPFVYSLAHIVSASQLQSVVASVSNLATGKFLVANRRLRDPNFLESVILLLEYSKDGAMGVIINRPTDIDLATVFSEVKEFKKRKELLYLGGPVGGNQVLLLACTAKEPKDSKRVLSDVYLVSSQISLQQLIEQGDASLKLRAYAGYAGWAPGQLDAEVSRGDWHLQVTDATAVFDTPADQLWPELIRRSEFEWTHSHQTNEHTAYSLY